ncbi:unnamed protein product [Paramecium sonneborni]|uniref:Uncharacterized protein n=1 Tax=Paramecium sonneborni TaxID=65129 RepID=A0A8S1RM68_9CILI|nr:unnamed protein product [Paramecium sonneborni]
MGQTFFVLKNLAAHRIKNRRTVLMYALSIEFVIFIFVGVSVQIENQATQTLQSYNLKIQFQIWEILLKVLLGQQIHQIVICKDQDFQ